MHFSDFGQRFRGSTGIGRLMRDLAPAGPAAQSPLVARLGGGNPAELPTVVSAFARCFRSFAEREDGFRRHAGVYAPPQGDSRCIHALVRLFRDHCGWDVGPEHIVLTNGSQNAFFMLFNLLAGRRDGVARRVLLPMTPEYIGYGDVGLEEGLFVSRRPDIELLDERLFKYHPPAPPADLDADVAAICVSRPTNPTGNVITDDEFDSLDRLAQRHDVPLIVDNAYGAPFPDIINVAARLVWHQNLVLSMSLSKIGLPAVRTGIVVARPSIVAALTEMNAVFNLSPGGLAAAAVAPMIESGEILTLARDTVRPFYRQRAAEALQWFDDAFAGLPARVHRPEGSIFLWLWFPDLPGGSDALYRDLKAAGVVVVPGHYFFPGLELDADDPFGRHRDECLRVNIAGDPDEVRRGFAVIADMVRRRHAVRSTPHLDSRQAPL